MFFARFFSWDANDLNKNRVFSQILFQRQACYKHRWITTSDLFPTHKTHALSKWPARALGTPSRGPNNRQHSPGRGVFCLPPRWYHPPLWLRRRLGSLIEPPAVPRHCMFIFADVLHRCGCVFLYTSQQQMSELGHFKRWHIVLVSDHGWLLSFVFMCVQV